MDLAIECHSLRKVYRKRFHPPITAVDGVSFEVASGQVVGLLGPNGAGKTTTLKILSTVIRPDAGSATVCGYDIRTQPILVRRAISMVTQGGWLNHYLSVKDNILVYALLHGQPWGRAVRRTSWAMDVLGLVKYKRMRSENLSGGFRRRVHIARTLATSAQCYFLDEPSVGLDPQARLEFWDRLGELVRESRATTFITTHSMDEVEALCDDVILIDKGAVKAVGPVTRLIETIGRTEIRVELGMNASEPCRMLSSLGYDCVAEGKGLSLKVQNNQRGIADILSALTDGGIVIKSLQVLPARFEDVYLSLVSRPESASDKEEAR